MAQVSITSREFKQAIENEFAFLRLDFGYKYSGVRSVDDDPRDAYVLARFSKGEERVDVAWNELAKSLSVLIRIDCDELGRKERYVYFEPFIEYVTNGRNLPIAPQIFPQMSMKKIQSVMKRRDEDFGNGLSKPMKQLASKLREHIELVTSCTSDTIRKYRQWYETRVE